MARPPQVLLLSDDVHCRQKWTKILQQSVDLFTAPLDLQSCGPEVPEVVVTDHLPLGEPMGPFNAQLVRGEIGVIGVATRGAADVLLPADYTGRELRLACSLLVQIVRLRRKRGKEKRAHRVLEQLAHRDALTDLANRRAWDAELATRLAEFHQRPAERGLCVGMLDLDCFKHVNDRFGHAAGDDLLRTVSGRLRHGVRSHDFVARIGGDEFAVLLAEIDPADADAALDRIRRSVEHLVEGGGGDPMTVTASVGYVMVHVGQPFTTDEVLAAADRSLLRAKTEGRNRTVMGSV